MSEDSRKDPPDEFPSRGPEPPAAGRVSTRPAPPPETSGRRSHLWYSRRPVLAFVLLFVVLLGPFSLLFYGYLIHTSGFEWYLALNARVSAFVLRLLGENASSEGTLLHSPEIALEIRHGCDAILPTAIFLAGVLASPVAFARKPPALIAGSITLLSINLVRIISLYYARLYRPAWFHTLHVDVWQPAFIFLALLFWLLWALRATRSIDPEPA